MIYQILAVVSLIMSSLAFMLIVWMLIELKAMQKSTHNIQYVPVPEPDDTLKSKLFGKKEKKSEPIIDETDVELFGDDFGDDI